MNNPDPMVLESIIRRAHYLANQMIFMANHRPGKTRGEPKVGGHASAVSSSIHVLGALHLAVRSGHDILSSKPHAAPGDHAFHYLLDLLYEAGGARMNPEAADHVMKRLRDFSDDPSPVFQSYHSTRDPDSFHFLPTGSVGIPPVTLGYLAHAYESARRQGYEIPSAHFWALVGDSEFREGSLLEALPDFAERELGMVTWIIDYNRQSLDGHRMVHRQALNGTDADRMERTFQANGWDVIQVRHGPLRRRLFARDGGEAFRQWLETGVTDYDLQVLLLARDEERVRGYILGVAPELADWSRHLAPGELTAALADMGGHDVGALIGALEASKANRRRPCAVIAHTIKGWGLDMAASNGNHLALPGEAEMDRHRRALGIPEDTPFARFNRESAEGKCCAARGNQLDRERSEARMICERNRRKAEQDHGGASLPPAVGVELTHVVYPHTQWMLGQIITKIIHAAHDAPAKPEGGDASAAWRMPASHIMTMSPDVGISTGMTPAMNGHIIGPEMSTGIEDALGVAEADAPDLTPGQGAARRYIRFEIQEACAMCCAGAYGQMALFTGVPFLPVMTIYDFFIKRALDQLYYNLYWRSSFILLGMPSGVTLSYEGAQHAWKSDLQIPQLITWEPYFCLEADWIFSDAVRRHFRGDHEGRTGVLIRAVTRGVDQAAMPGNLRRQARFKNHPPAGPLMAPELMAKEGVLESQVPALPDAEILDRVREEALAGAYFLALYEGYAGYEPGDNVVHIVAMGALVTEALEASRRLLGRGIYANVVVVTSPDLLAGHLAHADGYRHLRERLGMTADLHLHPALRGTCERADLAILAGRRVPIVSVHDGEPGLLDNLGSIIGTRQITLAVRRHSCCGRIAEIYAYHRLDVDSIIEACGQALAETALEQARISHAALDALHGSAERVLPDWRELWD